MAFEADGIKWHHYGNAWPNFPWRVIVGSHGYRTDTILSWVFLTSGVIMGILVILKMIASGRAVK